MKQKEVIRRPRPEESLEVMKVFGRLIVIRVDELGPTLGRETRRELRSSTRDRAVDTGLFRNTHMGIPRLYGESSDRRVVDQPGLSPCQAAHYRGSLGALPPNPRLVNLHRLFRAWLDQPRIFIEGRTSGRVFGRLRSSLSLETPQQTAAGGGMLSPPFAADRPNVAGGANGARGGGGRFIRVGGFPSSRKP